MSYIPGQRPPDGGLKRIILHLLKWVLLIALLFGIADFIGWPYVTAMIQDIITPIEALFQMNEGRIMAFIRHPTVMIGGALFLVLIFLNRR